MLTKTNPIRIFSLFLALIPFGLPLIAEDPVPQSGNPEGIEAANGPMEQLSAIMQEVMALYRSGSTDPAAYAPLMDKLDALHGSLDASNEELRVKILGARGDVYRTFLKDLDSAKVAYARIINDYPGTQSAEKAAQLIGRIELLQSMVIGAPFPELVFEALDGSTIDLEAYKGKVVLIDFWATWCPPCIAELPNLLATYQKYHDKGFDIIGISLDKDKERLGKFISDKQMDWPQYFDGKVWENELSTRFAISSIPTTYLLGTDGTIIARDLHGDELEKAVGQALAKQ